MRTPRAPTRRCAAWIVVIGGHLGLLVVVATGRFDVRVADTARLSVLLARIVIPPPPAPQPRGYAPRAPGARAFVRPPPAIETPLSGPLEGTRAGPSIDWERERRRAADAAARNGQPTARDCDEHETPGSMRRPCKKPTPFEWHPNPKAVEFDGLIPYVHVGKRCVVGLGFFGCGVGALPEANGRLLDDMRDPNRERSSVPDVPR